MKRCNLPWPRALRNSCIKGERVRQRGREGGREGGSGRKRVREGGREGEREGGGREGEWKEESEREREGKKRMNNNICLTAADMHNLSFQ